MIVGNQSCDTDTVTFVRQGADFDAIVVPHEDGKRRVGKGRVEIDKGGLTLGIRRRVLVDHYTADRGVLIIMRAPGRW